MRPFTFREQMMLSVFAMIVAMGIAGPNLYAQLQGHYRLRVLGATTEPACICCS